MKQYRLKKEAVQFFKDKYATSIHDYDTWESIGVDQVALEEIEDPYLSFGHRGNDSSWLSGWDSKGSHFHFTIHFPNVQHHEHDKLSKGKVTRELMNKIQQTISYFYKDFINGEES